jgi:hypothetical protein
VWARCLMLIATLVAANVAAAESQESSTTPLARKLTAFMKQRGLESVAAHLGPADQRFVAALYLPDQMLIVVAADYSAPALLKERILLEKFRDAYLDLSGASAPSSRVQIQDLGADGLRLRPEEGQSVDVFTRGAESPFVLDGDWHRRKLREEAYRATFDQAEAEYEQMLRALIVEASDQSQ